MKKLFLYIRVLLLMAWVVLFVLFGMVNSEMVSLNILILPEPAQLRMSTVIAAIFFVGFVFGVLCTFYVLSRYKLAAALKKNKAKKAQQKIEQNKALTNGSQPALPATTSNE